jgi:hypothetical protein
MRRPLSITFTLAFSPIAAAGCLRPALLNDLPLYAPDVGRIVVLERDSLLVREDGAFSRYRLVCADSQRTPPGSVAYQIPAGTPLRLQCVYGWEQLMLKGLGPKLMLKGLGPKDGWIPVRVTARVAIPGVIPGTRASPNAFSINLDEVDSSFDLAWRSRGPIDPPDPVYLTIQGHLHRLRPAMTDNQAIEALDLCSLEPRKEPSLDPSSPVSRFTFGAPSGKRRSLLIWRSPDEPRTMTSIEYSNAGQTVSFAIDPAGERNSVNVAQAGTTRVDPIP